MSFEHYIRSGSKLLRCGYTTGSCAALAALAAARTLLTGASVETSAIVTPKGLPVEVDIVDCVRSPRSVSCAVRKDGGDDCDATDGALIYAEVSLCDHGIVIDGGTGVGRVTKKGLDQPVGAAAINRVPRQMIASSLSALCVETGYTGGLSVIISVPGGEELAKHTFNGSLGITGGISILGTSGIVEPQSLQALVDSIGVELNVAAAEGCRDIILTPGNYGETFLETLPGAGRVPHVKCSNFFGDALDFAAVHQFSRVLVVAHMGKLVKLAGGIMNTHSRFADCRAELFAVHAALCGGSQELIETLMNAATSDACVELLRDAGLWAPVLQRLLVKIQEHLDHRVRGAFFVGAVAFSNQYGLLGITGPGQDILNQWRTEP
ncbi:MAG: cobalamin biosynthesis protein CbiD [Oscillospiraceae bacterium]|nr:cobalamin biosynthesis protein CbiD [Oscillospiraceae bacterium]